MIHLDYQDSRPIYEQIVDGFKKLILTGVLARDDQMPSVRAMAMELSTNPNTVQKAYAELERQGFIYTIRGRGNFVGGDNSLISGKKRELMDAMDKVLEEAQAYGLDRREFLQEWLQRTDNGEGGERS